MQKILRILFWGVACAALILIGSCTFEDPPTGEDETKEGTFAEFFEQVDEATGYLVSAPFMFMDSITAQSGAMPAMGSMMAGNDWSKTLEWLESTEFWYCTAVLVKDGATIIVIDSVQFRYLDGPIQYPINSDSLTSIISYAKMVITGSGIDTLYGSQNVTFTHNPNTDIMVLDGNGGSTALINDNDCQIEWDFDQAYTGVAWNTMYLHDDVSNELYCPYEGTVVHIGSFITGCFGSDIELDGDWTVTTTFDYGDVTYVVNQDSTMFTYLDTCETGFSEVMTRADTTFVEDVFATGATGNFLDGFGLSFALMVAEGNMNQEDVPTGITVVVDTIDDYLYDNGWHRFYFEAMTIDNLDTIYVTGVDSLRVISGTSPVDSIGDLSALTKLLHRSHISLSAAGIEGLIEGARHHNMTADVNSDGDDTTLTYYGDLYDTVTVVSGAGISGVCEVDLTLHQNITYLVLDPEAEGECPRSGRVTSDFNMDIGCDSGDGLNMFLVNGGWTVTALANGDNTVTLTYENDLGTISWSRTISCVNLSPSMVSIRNRKQ